MDECNTCDFNTLAESEACLCHSKCTDDLDDCFQDCVDSFTTLTELSQCYDRCQLSDNAGCRNRCGEIPEPISRNVIGFSYRYLYAFSSIPGDPLLSSNLVVTLPINITGNTLEIPAFNQLPTVFWPDVYFEGNTCFGVQVTVFYDDGLFCRRQEIVCNIIG